MEKDIFGLNHFLSPHTQLTNKDIQESTARAGLIEEMKKWCPAFIWMLLNIFLEDRPAAIMTLSARIVIFLDASVNSQ